MRQVRGDEVALIPQDPMTSLNPTMTIGRQIAEGRAACTATSAGSQARERALEVLRLVGMPQPAERLDQYPHELSGGLRQRVMIAMALACEPKLLIADEPTTALDVTIQAQILDLIDELRQRLAMAVVLITHDMGVIAGRTDRVVVMYAGKVAEEAETGELFGRIRHPYYRGPAGLGAQAGPATATSGCCRIPGLPPDLSQPDRRLPVRPPLPVRHRPVPAARTRPRATPPTRRASSTGSPASTRSDHSGRRARRRRWPAPTAGVGSRPSAAEAAARAGAARSSRSTDLVKEFPVMSGSVFRHQVGQCQGGLGRQLRHPQGRDLRAGRRVGLRQDHRRAGSLVALERPTSGSILFEGVRPDQSAAGAACAAAAGTCS